MNILKVSSTIWHNPLLTKWKITPIPCLTKNLQNTNSQSDDDSESPPVPSKNVYEMVQKEEENTKHPHNIQGSQKSILGP